VVQDVWVGHMIIHVNGILVRKTKIVWIIIIQQTKANVSVKAFIQTIPNGFVTLQMDGLLIKWSQEQKLRTSLI
jgi:hypothetical protein